MKISIVQMGKTRKRNVREAIISILSKEFPLNIKKIYNRVRKEYSLNVTYQAVFNMVKEMLEDGILEKSEREYRLNMNWIKNLKIELDMIMKKYNYAGDEMLNRIQDNINKFVLKVGPKVKEYLGGRKSLVLGINMGTGTRYGMALWRYLNREGLDSKYQDYDPLEEASSRDISLRKKDVQGRILLVVESSTLTGKIYASVMKKLNKFRHKLGLKDVKYVVDHDMMNLADFSRVRYPPVIQTKN